MGLVQHWDICWSTSAHYTKLLRLTQTCRSGATGSGCDPRVPSVFTHRHHEDWTLPADETFIKK